MTTDVETWRSLIMEGATRRPEPVAARTPLKRVGGYSKAAVVICNDQQRYVVKGQQVGRPLIADHVVGHLGRLIGAPVAHTALVSISLELVQASFSMMHFEAGVGHGSVFEDGCYDGWGIEHAESNRQRFALLAVLYGWAAADDHQFLYRKDPPHSVFSVDHGHFLPGGPNWTPSTLGASSVAKPDDLIASEAALSSTALHDAMMPLKSITDADIARVVATPPDSWSFSVEERIALAEYLARRRDDLLATVAPTGSD